MRIGNQFGANVAESKSTQNTNNTRQTSGLKLRKGLEKDTVSFTANTKVLSESALDLARKIDNTAIIDINVKSNHNWTEAKNYYKEMRDYVAPVLDDWKNIAGLNNAGKEIPQAKMTVFAPDKNLHIALDYLDGTPIEVGAQFAMNGHSKAMTSVTTFDMLKGDVKKVLLNHTETKDAYKSQFNLNEQISEARECDIMPTVCYEYPHELKDAYWKHNIGELVDGEAFETRGAINSGKPVDSTLAKEILNQGRTALQEVINATELSNRRKSAYGTRVTPHTIAEFTLPESVVIAAQRKSRYGGSVNKGTIGKFFDAGINKFLVGGAGLKPQEEVAPMLKIAAAKMENFNGNIDAYINEAVANAATVI